MCRALATFTHTILFNIISLVRKNLCGTSGSNSSLAIAFRVEFFSKSNHIRNQVRLEQSLDVALGFRKFGYYPFIPINTTINNI